MANGASEKVQYVYRFGGGTSEGKAGQKNLLGGKGANLAEMASIGLPVPPGFTISTEMCTRYYEEGERFPDSLRDEVAAGRFREDLFARCDRRLEAMFEEGAVEEVAALLARNDVPADAPVRRAIGVPEITALLAGTISRGDAIARAQRATRQYAKRQYTWFRNQPPASWTRIDKADPQFYFL